MRNRSRLLPVALVTVLTAVSGFFLTVNANAVVPPTPTGWTLAFADDFNGANNTLPSGANWIIDTGTSYPGGPANWGTGEIQTYTNSTANLRQDGAGNLRDHPDPQRQQLDLGAHRDPALQLHRAGRWHPAHRGPHPDAQRDRRRRARLLACVLGAGRALPGQLLELAGHRRVRHHGERQRHQLGLGRAALRRRSRRAVQRVQRPRREQGLPRLLVPVRLPHLPFRVGPHQRERPAAALVCRRHAVPHGQPVPGRRLLGADDQPRRATSSCSTWPWAAPSRTAWPGSARRPRARPRACRCGSTTWPCGPGVVAVSRRRHLRRPRLRRAATGTPTRRSRPRASTRRAVW